MNRPAVLLGVALLSGCATNPVTGRNQVLALPAVQTAYADASFALSAGIQRIGPVPPCDKDCGDAEDMARFARRVTTIGARLESAARDEAPELFKRIEGFQIEVDESLGVRTASSAGGRIVLGTELASLEPTDTVIAFLIAREMAHVIGRHAEEDSGASLVMSALGMILLPGFSLILRYVATTVASSALKRSWATDQQREADEIAVALLERSGISAPYIALELESGVKRARLPDDEWGARYRESTQRVIEMAVNAASPTPHYAAIGADSGRH
jgi:hypothetical protein